MLRYAFRLLAKSPTFTLTAVATLALCIGANTAVFSVVDAVLLRPLPYPEPERLYVVTTVWRGGAGEYRQLYQDGRLCEAVRRRAGSVDAAVYAGVSGVNFVSGGGARYVQQQRVSAGYFRVLGVNPLFGREFTVEEDRQGGPPIAVLSYDLWRRVFHGDPDAIGRKFTLRGEPYTVAGVMPAHFRAALPVDLWTPLRPSVTGEGAGANYTLVARLRPGASRERAETELAGFGADLLESRLRPGQSARLTLAPLQEGNTEGIRRPLLVVWAAVGVVLLIGCVNLALLLLARGGARTREIATRMALGSGRTGVVRQLLAESLLLAALGGLAGILVGRLALEGLRILALGPLRLEHFPIALDGRVLAATAATALLTSLLFGLYPAIQTTRVDIRSALAQSGARGVSGRSGRGRRALIAAETALAVLLLVSAGLLLRTFAHLNGQDPGFDAANAITASLSLQDARYATAAQANRLFDESLERIRRMPGMEAAGVGLTLPYERALNSGFKLPDGMGAISNVVYATPGFFEALRMRLLRGRAFTPFDRAEGRQVAIVNEAFVARYLRGQEVIGNRLRSGKDDREIVGIVADVQQSAGWGNFGPAGPVPAVYLPAAQARDEFMQLVHNWFSPSWVARSSAPPRGIIAGLQAAVAASDPELPFSGFRTMAEVRAQAFAMQKLNAVLLAALGGLALLLTAVGIYGLAAQSVVERTRELGIRMALGATRAQAVRTVSGAGVFWAALGLVPGCAAAVGAARLLRTLIWGVGPGDLAAYAGACLTLLVVAAAASLLPGLRAARIDPALTLREE